MTSNGPGELAGWVRPLVAALNREEPGLDVSLFFVPDDYATGREPEVARALFPNAHVVPPRDYVRFALGATLDGIPPRADVVQYLGGDLMHAARVHALLGGEARSYKFSRARYDKTFARVYAVDAANRRQLESWGVPPERIEVIGNLVVDAARAEADGAFSAAAESAAEDALVPDGGILIMPGARRNEVANLVPFFLRAALRLRTLAPDLPVVFGISPFTDVAELERALAGGGHPNVWGARGRVVTGERGALALEAEGDERTFPVIRQALRYARRARLVVTIPGTKCIELAALGVPTLVSTPYNVPEGVVINGPLQYLDRVPLLGIPLKRAIVLRYGARFRFTAQPNTDAGEELMPEMRGTLMPGQVALRAAEYARDDAGRAWSAARLRQLYAADVGASERMARSLLGLAAS